MSLASSVDHIGIEKYEDEVQIDDDLVIFGGISAPIHVEPTPVRRQGAALRDPIVPFLYLGIISLISIIATAAFLAL